MSIPSTTTTTMKAAQYHGPNSILISHIPVPIPSPTEALIAITHCGICGSDLHEYLHGPLSIPLPARPHPLTKSHIPITLGHEFVGRIISAPPSFSTLQPGTPVVVDPRIYCRECTNCLSGNTHLCTSLGFKGLSGSGGGFSEKITVDARLCYALPPDVNLQHACLIEPLTVAWHALRSTGLTDWAAKSVLVIGGGPVGVAVCIVLRAFACRVVVVSEPTSVRRGQNAAVADRVVNPVEDDVGEKCRELAPEGVDVVFDCAGNQRGFEAGMGALRHKGVYTNVAIWFGMPMQIPFLPFLIKEITIKSCFAYTDQDFKDVVEAFIAGRFNNLNTMVTSTIPIDDIVSKGFDELIRNKDAHVKILVTPN